MTPGTRARKGRAEFAPLLRTMPGFVADTIIEGKDIVSTVSVFQDREAAEESTRKAVAWAAGSVTDFDVPTEIVEGAVAVFETS